MKIIQRSYSNLTDPPGLFNQLHLEDNLSTCKTRKNAVKMLDPKIDFRLQKPIQNGIRSLSIMDITSST